MSPPEVEIAPPPKSVKSSVGPLAKVPYGSFMTASSVNVCSM